MEIAVKRGMVVTAQHCNLNCHDNPVTKAQFPERKVALLHEGVIKNTRRTAPVAGSSTLGLRGNRWPSHGERRHTIRQLGGLLSQMLFVARPCEGEAWLMMMVRCRPMSKTVSRRREGSRCTLRGSAPGTKTCCISYIVDWSTGSSIFFDCDGCGLTVP